MSQRQENSFIRPRRELTGPSGSLLGVRSHESRRRAAPAALGCAVALTLAAGCSAASATGTAGDSSTAKTGATVKVDARSVPGLGTVLVTSAGYALYMFEPDNRRSVSCTGVCAGTWPPLALPSGAEPAAGPGVKQSLLGSDPNPGSSGRVVTYDGWPLYTYTGDVQPDQATGQNIDLNGGEWYVLNPAGQPVIPAP
jgi:predicted lipoprotein with Yx(FWY)xxD motif